MVFMVVSGFLIALAVATLAVLLLWSWPGKPKPFLDEGGHPLPDSISEKVRVDINGFEQGMFLRALDKTRPVLLYLHGGMPEYFLSQRYPTGLESEFVVCWWEQRGAGLSYRPGMSPDSLAVEHLVADTVALTNHLRGRFAQDRIYLMGHSGGSFVGMHAVARAPEFYHAYIGVSQMANQLRSEKRAYDYMLERCRVQGRAALGRKLEAAPVTLEGGVPPAYLRVRDEAMHVLGVGTMREMRSVLTGLFLLSLRNPDYTLAEKISMWRAKAAMGVSSIYAEMLATDLAERIPRVGVPLYFLHGVHDYTCTYAEALAYFDSLTAPLKGFYTFSKSAHSPIFEEPGKVMAILREDVLRGTNRLADRT
ncbi:MAG: putative hydrolase or acyltransferase of alpha/beta superfamily [candidate division NC10 bacterium]|nr:putative hydrolase or acyltransferase of alpha/beta superfamily [candidate division NC10 bacterium]